MKYRSASTSETPLEGRLLLLPIAWAAYGLGLVYGLDYLFGPILNIIPTVPNDKPIGGAVFPVLFFNIAAVLAVLAVSLYSVGIWNIDVSKRKDKADLVAVVVVVASGFMWWYSALFVAPFMGALIYLLAVNIE